MIFNVCLFWMISERARLIKLHRPATVLSGITHYQLNPKGLRNIILSLTKQKQIQVGQMLCLSGISE